MSLPANAKILYGVLSSLMRREGYCWPSNTQLAEAMHCSEDVISRWVAALGKAGHIRIVVEPNRKIGGNIRYISTSIQQPLIPETQGGCRTNVREGCRIKIRGMSDKLPGYYIRMDIKRE